MKRVYCDNPKCGKEILKHHDLIIPPGGLLERHALKVELSYASPEAPHRFGGDFCRQCQISAIAGLDGARPECVINGEHEYPIGSERCVWCNKHQGER